MTQSGFNYYTSQYEQRHHRGPLSDHRNGLKCNAKQAYYVNIDGQTEGAQSTRQERWFDDMQFSFCGVWKDTTHIILMNQ